MHILGAGAVGLAYGALLTAHGHAVVHTSLREGRVGALPVRARIGGEMVRSVYTPRFVASGSRPAADVNLFASAPSACGRYLDRRTDEDGTADLVFAGVFDRDWRARLGPWPTPDPTLVFPLISCEHRPGAGLSLVTDLEVEALVSPGRDRLAGSLLEAMGLKVSAWVGVERFLARYVQTAAAYAVLEGLARRRLDPGQVDRTLLTHVLAQLLEAAEGIHPDQRLDFPAPPAAAFAALPPLIAMAVSDAPSDDPLVLNLRWLLSPDGARKLANHLAPFRSTWRERPPAAERDVALARRLLDAVLGPRGCGDPNPAAIDRKTAESKASAPDKGEIFV